MSKIRTLSTPLPKSNSSDAHRLQLLAQRTEDLNSYGRVGYTLTHTYVLETEDSALFIDTLTREDDA